MNTETVAIISAIGSALAGIAAAVAAVLAYQQMRLMGAPNLVPMLEIGSGDELFVILQNDGAAATDIRLCTKAIDNQGIFKLSTYDPAFRHGIDVLPTNSARRISVGELSTPDYLRDDYQALKAILDGKMGSPPSFKLAVTLPNQQLFGRDRRIEFTLFVDRALWERSPESRYTRP